MSIFNNKKQEGFTIVELLVATVVFSIILLVATSGIIQLGRLYYKGIIEARTQESTRAIFEDVSRSVQFAKGGKQVVPSGSLPVGVTQFCIGDTRYSYKVDEPVSGVSSTGLRVARISPNDTCAGAVAGQQLLGENMRILELKVESVGSGDVYSVSAAIAHGDNFLLSHYNDDGSPVNPATVITDAASAKCKTGIGGSSFCAVAQLDTIIKKRLID